MQNESTITTNPGTASAAPQNDKPTPRTNQPTANNTAQKVKTTSLRRPDETLCWYCKRCTCDYIMKDALTDTSLRHGEIPDISAFSGKVDRRPCEWFSKEKPVPGWVAKKEMMICSDSSYDEMVGREHRTVESYKVLGCPKFKADKYVKAYKLSTKEVSELLCVAFREVRSMPAVARATVMHFIDLVNVWLYGKDPLKESIQPDGTYHAIRSIDIETLIELELRAVKVTYEEALDELEMLLEDGYAKDSPEYLKALATVKNAVRLHRDIRVCSGRRPRSGKPSARFLKIKGETPLTYKSERSLAAID